MTFFSLKRIVPPVGSMNPAIMRRSVVFPQPEGPSRKKSSPGTISRLMPSTAAVAARPLPKVLFRLRIEIDVGIRACRIGVVGGESRRGTHGCGPEAAAGVREANNRRFPAGLRAERRVPDCRLRAKIAQSEDRVAKRAKPEKINPSTDGPATSGSAAGGRANGKPAGAGKAEGGPAPISLDPVVRAIENVRRLRVRAEPRRTVSDVVKLEEERLAKVERSIGGVEQQWSEVVPPHLKERCWVRGVSRRILTVGVDDPSMGYEMSMWLRGGGERALSAATGHKVSKVKVEVVATRPGG